MAYFLPLISAFFVFPLWLFEKVFPYPYLVEEVFKFLAVVFFLRKEKRKVFYALLSGVFFSLSETFFYFARISLNTQLTTLFSRLFLTTTLHIFTFTFAAFLYSKNKKLVFIALSINIIAHYLYNYFIASHQTRFGSALLNWN